MIGNEWDEVLSVIEKSDGFKVFLNKIINLTLKKKDKDNTIQIDLSFMSSLSWYLYTTLQRNIK